MLGMHRLRLLSRRAGYWEPVRLVMRVRQIGLRRVIPELPNRIARKVRAYVLVPIMRRRVGHREFRCDGTSYRYFVHSYNGTWRNERCVEMPLALEFAQSSGDGQMLEIGNVVRHYDPSLNHTVVDRYDIRSDVINADIEGYAPAEPYGGVLSISTLEHVGWDEEPQDADKLARVLASLHRLVSDPEQVLVTMPIGYNPWLDEMIRCRNMPFRSETFLVRRGSTLWLEASAEEALACRMNAPYDGANALYVGRGLVPLVSGSPREEALS